MSVRRSLLWGLITSGIFLFHVSLVQAQSSQAVTATVPSNAGPSAPVLISPANNSIISTNKPGFVWEESTDDDGINHYELHLDGSLLFDNIPTSATENSSYVLTYDAVTGRYTLTPKSALSENSHTWKIRAVDTSANTTDSATWTFTIDTVAPSFVLSKIGSVDVNISAQDPGTIPSSPIELADNEPLLVASGEANSSVSTTLTIPGYPTQNFSNSIGAGGYWSLQLGILPRDIVMTLDFTITDAAGNISVLNGVTFFIKTQVIVIPPTPSPTPSIEPTPIPSEEPVPTPEPSPSPLVPAITIPVIPPREIIYNLTRQLTSLIPPISLPQPVAQVIVTVAETAAPVSAVIVASAVPVATTVAVASQFGSSLSFDLLVKILQALGLIPAGKPKGLVFESETYEPVPFALLTVKGQGQIKGELRDILETVVSDVTGVYRGLSLPPGNYQITASQQGYEFPTKKRRPIYLEVFDYYRGENFTVGTQEKQYFLIPMDQKEKDHKVSWKTRLRVNLTRLTRKSNVITLPLFLLSGVLATLYPTIWNLSVFGLYTLITGNRVVSWLKVPRITGQVIDENGQPVKGAIIRLTQAGTNNLEQISLSSSNGKYSLFVPKGLYLLSVNKEGLIWYEQNAPLSNFEIDVTTQNQHIVSMMKPAVKPSCPD